jgi:hypothetical protein
MLEKHNPSWGNKVVGSGQVHCVRRLGLSDEQWESVRPTGPERMFAGERHITCVKMSSEHADEVSRVPGPERPRRAELIPDRQLWLFKDTQLRSSRYTTPLVPRQPVAQPVRCCRRIHVRVPPSYPQILLSNLPGVRLRGPSLALSRSGSCPHGVKVHPQAARKPKHQADLRKLDRRVKVHTTARCANL